MTPEQFATLANQGHNRIPLMREVLADLDTPLSVYLKLADGPYSYLFESVQGGEKWGRYSIIGLPCRTLLRVNGLKIINKRMARSVKRQTLMKTPPFAAPAPPPLPKPHGAQWQ